MDGTELLFILWFAVSVGCVLVAWIKGHWTVGVIVAIVALIVGYLIGVVR
jgi:hypothetical protein